MNKPYVLIINGPIGAGKSTLADYLKSKLPEKTAFLDLDQIKLCLNCKPNSFWKNPSKSRSHNELTRLIIVDLIEAYTKRGVNVAISSTWKLEFLNQIKNKFKYARFFHIFLNVSWENSKQRIKSRKGGRKILPTRHKISYDFYSFQHDDDTIFIDSNKSLLAVRRNVLKGLKGKII